MTGPRITYASHPDVTPEAELDALSWIYKLALNKEKAAGTNGGSNDAEKGIKDESGTKKQAYRNGSPGPTPNQRNKPETQEEREIATEVLTKNVNALAIEDAISRAPRSRPDKAGRTWRIGAHVGKMCRQLVYWEGKGQDNDNRVHKTAREWFESEAGLTRAQLRTATRIAEEEDLLSAEIGERPSDRQTTVYYRLNVWTVTSLVIALELQKTEQMLKREGRKRRRHELGEKRRELEQALRVMAVVDGSGRGNPEPPVEDGQVDRTPLANSSDPPSGLMRPSAQVAAPTEDHPSALPEEHSLSGQDERIEMCAKMLQSIEGFELSTSAVRRLVSVQADRYPLLDLADVCREYRDHAAEKAGKGDPIRSHPVYLPNFFERMDRGRTSERPNPHGAEAERVKDKPMKAERYVTEHGVSFEFVDSLIESRLGHAEIERAIKAERDALVRRPE